MIPKSDFNKNVLTVMTGTGLAQVITLLLSPVLTRIFTPEEFGIFYLFSSLTDIISVPATGRYELAILLPKDKDEAAHTFWTAGFLATIYSLALLIFVFIFNQQIGSWLHEPKICPWLYLLPLFILVKGWMTAFHYWHNRHKRFKVLTTSKIAESSVNGGSRVGLGILSFGTGGLIVGTLLGRLATLTSYVFYFWKKDKIHFPKFQKAKFKKQLHRFKNFPKDMIPAGLFNTGSVQLPNILINYFYTEVVVGHFGFMNRILRMPLAVMGRSFEEVFKQKASEELQTLGHCRNVFYKTLKKLILLSAFPFIIFFIASPWIFEFVFGEKWRIAGEYAQIFTLPLFINFLTGSLSAIFYLKEKTKIFSRLNLLQLSLVIFAFFISYYYQLDALVLIYLLALAYCISYLLSLFFLVKIVEEDH